MGIGEWAVGNDSVRLAFGHTRQAKQIFAGSFVEVDGLLAAQAFLHTLHHGLGIALHGSGRLRGTLTDLIGIVAGCAGDDDRKQQSDHNEPRAAER